MRSLGREYFHSAPDSPLWGTPGHMTDTSGRTITFEGKPYLFQIMRALMISSISWPRALPTSAMNVHLAARDLCLCCDGWNRLDLAYILTALSSFCFSKGAEISWFYFHDSTGNTRLDLIPSSWGEFSFSSDRNPGELKPILLTPTLTSIHSWFPKEEYLEVRPVQHLEYPPSIASFMRMPHHAETIQQFIVAPTSLTLGRWGGWQPGTGPTLIMLQHALWAAMAWLEDPGYWKRLSFERRGVVRGALRYQLYEVIPCPFRKYHASDWQLGWLLYQNIWTRWSNRRVRKYTSRPLLRPSKGRVQPRSSIRI